jgi:hypothetical protein
MPKPWIAGCAVLVGMILLMRGLAEGGSGSGSVGSH